MDREHQVYERNYRLYAAGLAQTGPDTWWARDSYEIARILADAQEGMYGVDLFLSEQTPEGTRTMWVFGPTRFVEVANCTSREQRDFAVHELPLLTWTLSVPGLSHGQIDLSESIDLRLQFRGHDSGVLSGKEGNARYLYELISRFLAPGLLVASTGGE
jgi:hypothetical protein